MMKMGIHTSCSGESGGVYIISPAGYKALHEYSQIQESSPLGNYGSPVFLPFFFWTSKSLVGHVEVRFASQP